MKKILIIEDEKNIVFPLKIFFENEGGYEVLHAGDGFEGIEIAQREKPDLIILDIVLPGIDGYLVCKNLKNNISTGNIPVITISAKTSKDDIKKMFDVGADEYIPKPFSLDKIKKLISKYFGEDQNE
ncbi:MAG: response regulator [Actinomycetota bacterium]|nr:response regulator [Actinomycetota bacterium]